MNRDEILAELVDRGVIRSPSATTQPLSGGVSGELWLIDDGTSRVVLKRALPKLRVADDWFADVSRNRFEHEYLDYVSSFRPDAVPRVLYRSPNNGFFVMEYLDGGLANWKQLLLAGQVDAAHVQRVSRLLGEIHRRSWNDEDVRRRFATLENFRQLRIEPYLLTTAARHPRLRQHFQDEADRLANTSICLVHGDYSPKNMLVGKDRAVVLDCEVAWFGDPAFDVAFLLNHLLLKSLYCSTHAEALLAAAGSAWACYLQELTGQQSSMLVPGDLDYRVGRLLLLLLLARVDGKSPVEYLTDAGQKQLIRDFVSDRLPRGRSRVEQVLLDWSAYSFRPEAALGR